MQEKFEKGKKYFDKNGKECELIEQLSDGKFLVKLFILHSEDEEGKVELHSTHEDECYISVEYETVIDVVDTIYTKPPHHKHDAEIEDKLQRIKKLQKQEQEAWTEYNTISNKLNRIKHLYTQELEEIKQDFDNRKKEVVDKFKSLRMSEYFVDLFLQKESQRGYCYVWERNYSDYVFDIYEHENRRDSYLLQVYPSCLHIYSDEEDVERCFASERESDFMFETREEAKDFVAKRVNLKHEKGELNLTIELAKRLKEYDIEVSCDLSNEVEKILKDHEESLKARKKQELKETIGKAKAELKKIEG